jgi:diaminopimelate epimerase
MLDFTKWEGLGNDFVVTEIDWQQLKDPSSLAKLVCDRHLGVGADGLVFLTREAESLGMKIWNADGTLAKMCGNALRCLAARSFQIGWLEQNRWVEFSTDSGPKALHLSADSESSDCKGRISWVEVDMGTPVFGEQPVTYRHGDATLNLNAVSMGNPHLVISGSELQPELWLECSLNLQSSTLASEGGVNVEWWSRNPDSSLEVWVYERGVGPTLACGTGACAVYAHLSRNETEPLSEWVHLPGGSLRMSRREGRIFMNGPARQVFSGQLDWSIEFL